MTIFKKYKFQIALVIATWLCYANTLNHDYAGDDVIVITSNDRVQQGWNGIPSLFKNIKSDQTQHRYGYRPISLISFAVDIGAFGLNPFWGHLHNILLYTILILVIHCFLSSFFPQFNSWQTFIITLLFTAHPLHTEVVANIKSRDEILAMLFGILSVMNYGKWIKTKNKKYLMLSLLTLVAAFLSKENAITYVGIFLIFPFLINSENKIKLSHIITPLISLILLLGIYKLSLSSLIFEQNSIELFEKGLYHEDRFSANPLVDISSFLFLFLNSLWLLVLDIKLLHFPYPLAHDYGFNQVEIITEFTDLRWLIGLCLSIGLIILCIKSLKKNPEACFGILFFIITLSIYLHLVKIGPDYLGERFLFAPILGWSICIVWLLSKIPHKLSKAITLTITIVFVTLTIQRNKAWKNNLTLYETDLPHLKKCARFHYNYASLLHVNYYSIIDEKTKQQTKQKILTHYETAYNITERIFKLNMDLGNAYMEFNEPDKAYPIFLKATKNYSNLSVPYFQLGKYYITKNDFATARKQFSKAIEKGEKNANTYYYYAICELKLGNLNAAINTLNIGLPYAINNKPYIDLLNKLKNNPTS